MIRTLLTFLPALCLSVSALAQIVTVQPPFPTQTDDVTITYYADRGNGELTGVVPVFAHTGVILQGQSGWQHVQGNWGQADGNVLMDFAAPNTFTISYNITDYYGVQPGEVVEQLAFVFRNANGSLVGRTESGGDIFTPVYPEGVFAAEIRSPFTPQTLTEAQSAFDFIVQANESADIAMYLGPELLTSAQGVDSLHHAVDFTALPPGKHWLWMEATGQGETIVDSTYVIIQGEPEVASPPAGVIDGINYVDDHTVVLQLYAPYKEFVYVLGDFNEWEFSPEYFMKKTPEGDRFWLEIEGLEPGIEYGFQYSIDQEDLRVADIYVDKVLDPWNDPYISADTYPGLKPYPAEHTHEIVGVLETGQVEYQWQDEDFQRPPADNLVVYELLLRDFLEDHSFASLTDTLSYLERLGVNAIELMPIAEFEGNISWGYNPMFFFAPDKYYGPKDDLKAFVDACHQRGIAVILDVVYNHSFGQNPQVRMYSENGASGPVTSENPWFNVVAKHPFNVGYDYNHESPATQAFVDRNIRYWAEEYHIDGFRFDLSKGFTQNHTNDVGAWNQYDQSRVDNLLRIRDGIYGYDPDLYLILEHLGNNDEEEVLAEAGFMLWGIMNHAYNQTSMGYGDGADLSWGDYQQRGWGTPALVTYAESHDEERLMFRNLAYGNSSGEYNVQDLETALARQEAISAFLIPLRGPKMMWQFGELGYEYSINTCEDGSVNDNCRLSPKPIRWDYLEVPARKRLYKVIAALNHLKTTHEAFRSDTYTWDAGGMGKRLIIQHETMDVVIVANFEVDPITMVPGFTQTGTWYDYFAGTSMEVSDLESALTFQPGEYRVFTTVELETPDISVGLEERRFDGGELRGAWPNPFDDETHIAFRIEESSRASLRIHDVRGGLVATLVDARLPTGEHEVRWAGKDEAGRTVPAGIYLAQLITAAGQGTVKIAFAP